MKNGDYNTKFFHSKATTRHRKNIIKGIFDESNSWHDQQDEISGVLLKYYQELFSMSNLVSSNATLTYVPHVITEDMNNMLMGEFLEGEFKMALKQMALLKPLGLDGMPPFFISTFGRWSIRM